MTSTNVTDSASNLDEQRLALDKARLEIELARLKLDSSFAKKWGGAPLAAGLFGLILGVFQLIVVFIQKDTEMKAASDLKLKEFQLADAERDRRSKTEAAQFVMTHRALIFPATNADQEQRIVVKLMAVTFPKETMEPIFENIGTHLQSAGQSSFEEGRRIVAQIDSATPHVPRDVDQMWVFLQDPKRSDLNGCRRLADAVSPKTFVAKLPQYISEAKSTAAKLIVTAFSNARGWDLAAMEIRIDGRTLKPHSPYFCNEGRMNLGYEVQL